MLLDIFHGILNAFLSALSSVKETKNVIRNQVVTVRNHRDIAVSQKIGNDIGHVAIVIMKPDHVFISALTCVTWRFNYLSVYSKNTELIISPSGINSK